MPVSVLNFDYNATAPLESSVRDACLSAMDVEGNPSSIHQMGRLARRLVETARHSILQFLGLDTGDIAYDLIFTSGATESNVTVIKGFAGAVLVSAIEHTSVLEVRPDAVIAPVDNEGRVQLAFIEEWLSNQTKPVLVAIMAANNETGVVQPMAEVAALCRKYNARFHCDAVQAFSRIPLDMTLFDSISLSAHKIGGLMGVGCLVIKDGFQCNPLIVGGGQEKSKRAGTENVVGCWTFASAIKMAMSAERTIQWKNVNSLRALMEGKILMISPESKIIGQNADRLPNTIAVSMPGVKAETQVIRLDLEGFCVSAGSACSSGKIRKSHVLEAMGIGDDVASTVLRISLPPSVSGEEIDTFLSAWKRVYTSLNQEKING